MLFLLREKYGESFFKDSKEEAIKQFDSLIGVGEIEMLPSMVDTLPFPFGGYDSIRKYLEGLKISTVDRVMVSFDVDKIGNISNVVVRGKLNDSSRELIKNAFLKMPRWKPAIYHGNPRGFRVTVPISSRE